MLTLTYRPRVKNKLRWLFELRAGSIVLHGQLFQRAERDWFWNFGGQFPWQVGDGLPPFSFILPSGVDAGSLLFFGIPQALLTLLEAWEPPAAQIYTQDRHRNCGNCAFAIYHKDRWEAVWDRPTHARYEALPTHLYSCAVSGDHIDHLPDPGGYSPRVLRIKLGQSLLENSCSAHTRRAYRVALSPESRPEGQTERWVPSELRRLQCLNPASILFSSDRRTLFLPYDLTIGVRAE